MPANKEPPRHLSKQQNRTLCYAPWSRGYNIQSVHHNSFTKPGHPSAQSAPTSYCPTLPCNKKLKQDHKNKTQKEIINDNIDNRGSDGGLLVERLASRGLGSDWIAWLTTCRILISLCCFSSTCRILISLCCFSSTCRILIGLCCFSSTCRILIGLCCFSSTCRILISLCCFSSTCRILISLCCFSSTCRILISLCCFSCLIFSGALTSDSTS